LLKTQVPQAFDVFGPQIVALNSSTSVCAKDVGSTCPNLHQYINIQCFNIENFVK